MNSSPQTPHVKGLLRRTLFTTEVTIACTSSSSWNNMARGDQENQFFSVSGPTRFGLHHCGMYVQLTMETEIAGLISREALQCGDQNKRVSCF